jgi:hypothetical protein
MEQRGGEMAVDGGTWRGDLFETGYGHHCSFLLLPLFSIYYFPSIFQEYGIET